MNEEIELSRPKVHDTVGFPRFDKLPAELGTTHSCELTSRTIFQSVKLEHLAELIRKVFAVDSLDIDIYISLRIVFVCAQRFRLTQVDGGVS